MSFIGIQQLRSIVSNDPTINCLSNFYDGCKVVCGGAESLEVWALCSGRPLKTFPNSFGVCCVIFRPPSSIVSAHDDMTLKVWDLHTTQCLTTLRGHKGPVSCVVVLGDKTIVSGSYDCSLIIWDDQTSEPNRFLNTEAPVIALTVLTNDRIASGHSDGVICIWHLNSNFLPVYSQRSGPQITCLTTLSPKKFISGSVDGTLKLWNSQGYLFWQAFHGECIRTVAVARRYRCRIISAGGDYWTYRGSLLKIWDAYSGSCLQSISYLSDIGPVRSVVVDGDLVITCGQNGMIKLFWS